MLEKLLIWTDKHLGACLIAIFLLRAGFLWSNGLALIGDETYYWDWSRHPDWCYYSKPPMVAWLIAISSGLLGDTAAFIRLPAAILGTLSLWFFHATAQAFYGRRAAAFALIMILATPDNVLTNLIMTIDPPLNFFWVLSLFFLRRAIFDQRQDAWLWAGCATGAGILSKQVAIAIPLMLLVFIVLDRHRRIRLKREFLIYLTPVLIAGIPVIWWNQQHAWVMFHHSQEHFTTQIAGSLSAAGENFASLVFYQLILISPLIFSVAVIYCWQSVPRLGRLNPEQLFLTLMGPVLLSGILLLSVVQRVQGNWPMPFYFSTLILLSGWWRDGRWRKTLEYGVRIGLVLVLMTYLLPNLIMVLNLKNTRLDPTKRFNYWPQLAGEIQAVRSNVLPDTENSFVVSLGHRNITSQLAFYLPDHPHIFHFATSSEIKTQYELWPGPDEFYGKNALVITDNDSIPAQLQAAFEKLNFIRKIPNPADPRRSTYYLYLGEQLKNWPETYYSR